MCVCVFVGVPAYCGPEWSVYDDPGKQGRRVVGEAQDKVVGSSGGGGGSGVVGRKCPEVIIVFNGKCHSACEALMCEVGVS